ncbi:MAG: hypothetical protein M1834_002405 [Cirrosporium novae-zelandiae]|nr:MAG: hypothetical protein M1834_002405 [Cirrosporium novae-zelandiae]
MHIQLERHQYNHRRDVWKESPILTGSTAFEPLPTMKNILVTGGAGFIGSWMARHLATVYKDYYNIIVLDNLDYNSSINNIRALEGARNFKFVYGDITKTEDVMSCLLKYHIDTILHFAAKSCVDDSFRDACLFTTVNVFGTQVLLDCSRKLGITKFIHVSTDEVYGEPNGKDSPAIESSVLSPTNPYSASKAAAEMIVNSYKKSFNLPIIITRCNNVYGPHQFPEKVVPRFSLLLLKRKRVPVMGDGTHIRNYLYAGDAINAFDTILHKGIVGETYNIVAEDASSTRGICSRLLRSLGISCDTDYDLESWIRYVEDRPFNDHQYLCSGHKLRALGWKPRTKLDDGLRITIDWYKRFGEQWWGTIPEVTYLDGWTPKFS